MTRKMRAQEQEPPDQGICRAEPVDQPEPVDLRKDEGGLGLFVRPFFGFATTAGDGGGRFTGDRARGRGEGEGW
jgi:hypothetical protein